MTSGTRKMSKQNYQAMRTVADTFGKIGLSRWDARLTDACSRAFPRERIRSLPHFTTVFRRLRPMVYSTLGPRGQDFWEDVDMTKAGARCGRHSENGKPQAPVRIIVPSEFARADMATGPVFLEIMSTSLTCATGDSQIPSVQNSECVDVWPIIAARDWYYGPPRYFNVEGDLSPGPKSSFAEAGDTVQVSFITNDALRDSFKSSFHPEITALQYARIEGIVAQIWIVHHEKRRYDEAFSGPVAENLSPREREIVTKLSFATYCSPTDGVSVEIPDLPSDEPDGEYDDNGDDGYPKKKKHSPEMTAAIKARKAALKERSRQTEIASAGWKKPVLKPGDTVALLRPKDFATQSPNHGHYVLLVHRFWTENEESDRHILFISSNSEYTVHSNSSTGPGLGVHFEALSSPGDLYSDVTHVGLVSKHRGRRGPEAFQPVSSIGKLRSGEDYFIYRFALFWDGFEIKEGSSASGEGFYLMCLNLPMHSRASSSSVRVISLTPPGVKSASILRRIQDDITTGMTEGYVDYDARGEKRRIFLDLVGFIGDTPALNASLDVMGHTARCCCHLCRFHRHSSSAVGSRYAQIDFHGQMTHLSRNYYVHTAVRDCGAQKETCKLLGMRPTAPDDTLPIHDLWSAIFAIRSRIPKTLCGNPIVPCILDPYKSCFIVPDHLLTGHSRDCINAVFKLLPSQAHRILSEQYILGLISDCQAREQNRLFDHKGLKLHAMSMSDMYALILVAELGFRQGCDKAGAQSMTALPSRCLDALDVLSSCARLISELFYIPEENRDGPLAVSTFNECNGTNRIIQLQALTIEHISKVRNLCSMLDEDISYLRDPSTDKRKRARISKDYLCAMKALKALDKPNVHRLQELVFGTLPMVGHIARIGELVMEKAHQPLKRSIKHSNNKDPQLFSMKSITVNDWQGRLTLLVPGALQKDKQALLGCFRLLAGREAVYTPSGNLEPAHIAEVLEVLGPQQCIPNELRAQDQTVLSPRHNGLVWVLEGNVEVAGQFTTLSSPKRRSALSSLSLLYRMAREFPSIQFGDFLRLKTSGGTTRHMFGIGDVIEILCCSPKEFMYHVPFVIQPNNSSGESHLHRQSVPMLWCITALFKTRKEYGYEYFQASVLPCLKVPQNPNPEPRKHHYRKYCVGKTLSFAKILPETRRVAILHDCIPSTCTPSPSGTSIIHANNSKPLEGGYFYVRCRKDGFPSRKG